MPFLEDRIQVTEELIVIYEEAMIALGTHGVQEYWIDTGQTRTKVTKFDLPGLNRTLDTLYNRQATLCARLTGGGRVRVRPSW